MLSYISTSLAVARISGKMNLCELEIRYYCIDLDHILTLVIVVVESHF